MGNDLPGDGFDIGDLGVELNYVFMPVDYFFTSTIAQNISISTLLKNDNSSK